MITSLSTANVHRYTIKRAISPIIRHMCFVTRTQSDHVTLLSSLECNCACEIDRFLIISIH